MTIDNTSRDTADRMDLPFVGLATFARQPACPDWDKLNGADVARMPFDTASSYRVGMRFGPRAIREVSMFHGLGPEGVFDFEDEFTYLTADEMKIVDAGGSDVISADKKRRHGISHFVLDRAKPRWRTRRPKRTAVVSRLPNRRPVNETGAARRP
jgi:agmatinase